MARFIIKSIIATIVTMLLVSIALFILVEVGSGDISVKILGVFATPEQRASYNAQLGLDAPTWQRYLDWLIGSDWRAEKQVGHPLVTLKNPQTGESDWYAEVGDEYMRWEMKDGQLLTLVRQEDGSVKSFIRSLDWKINEDGQESFCGVDNKNNAVMWVRGEGAVVWQ
ncbi:MAG: hypothetical protein P8Y72_14605, partial [Anaerolineales bacterium]